MLGMQPAPQERLAGGAFALRNLVFMMRKCQVDPAGMNIQCLTEIFHGHRRALNVPPRPSWPDHRLPELLARFRRFPQGKIPRTPFFLPIVSAPPPRLIT